MVSHPVKSFCTAKEAANTVKRKSTVMEISASYSSDTGLMSKIGNELKDLAPKQQAAS